VKLSRSSDEGREVFTYVATDRGVMPLKWETVSSAGAGISGARVSLLIFAAHCTLATMILVWWTLRKYFRKKTSAGA